MRTFRFQVNDLVYVPAERGRCQVEPFVSGVVVEVSDHIAVPPDQNWDVGSEQLRSDWVLTPLPARFS